MKIFNKFNRLKRESIHALGLILISGMAYGQSVNFTEVTTPFVKVSDGSVAFADLNGDGYQDVLLTGIKSGGIQTSLYLNDGNGWFSSATHPFENVMYSDSAFADIDNDGKIDLLIMGVKNNNQRVTSLYKNGTTMSSIDLQKNSIQIYPNPSQGIFNLKAEKSFNHAKIIVTTVAGQTIFAKTFSGELIQIDLSHSPAGVYFVSVNGRNYKLIKN